MSNWRLRLFQLEEIIKDDSRYVTSHTPDGISFITKSNTTIFIVSWAGLANLSDPEFELVIEELRLCVAFSVPSG
jgi:hypothetical protein